MNYRPPSRDQLLPKLSWDQSVDLLGTIIPSQRAPVAISGEIPCFEDDPLNSMHASRLMSFSSDLAFAERAASYSCFSAENFREVAGQFGIPEVGDLSKITSGKFSEAKESPIQSCALSEMGEGEFGSGREDSSVTNPATFPGDRNAKKRKAACRRKGKAIEENELNAKKCRSSECTIEDGDKKNGKDNGSSTIEPPTDYIHVRARRGQATDSHSLAERVRREKISQRMKLLQDLVPGCNKITGKALMLDEIINYVQSLQRQVEFLSMKLATLNPGLDFINNLFTKEFLTNHVKTSMLNSFYPIGDSPSMFPFGQQSKEGSPYVIEVNCPIRQCESTLYQPLTMDSSLDILGGQASQMGNLLDDVFHNVLQSSFAQSLQNQDFGVISQSFPGKLPATQMKMEF